MFNSHCMHQNMPKTVHIYIVNMITNFLMQKH